jgi:hypothetical protein
VSTSNLPAPVHPLSVPKPGRSLAERFPEIAATWDDERNHPLTPADVTARSNRKAWFVCPEHGSWEAYISNRTAGNGCKLCGQRSIGETLRQQAVARGTLASLHPALAAQWHPTLNTLAPEDIPPATRERGWWICPQGHEPYQTPVKARTRRGTGCPVCGNISRLSHLVRYEGPKPGTSLGDLRPDVAAEWDHDRNELTPFQVARYSHAVAHWRCGNGHRYTRKVHLRVVTAECPECRNARLGNG